LVGVFVGVGVGVEQVLSGRQVAPPSQSVSWRHSTQMPVLVSQTSPRQSWSLWQPVGVGVGVGVGVSVGVSVGVFVGVSVGVSVGVGVGVEQVLSGRQVAPPSQSVSWRHSTQMPVLVSQTSPRQSWSLWQPVGVGVGVGVSGVGVGVTSTQPAWQLAEGSPLA
jgi:hypothetical protein